MGELMNRAAQLRHPAHPLAGILKQRYEEALSLIDKRAAHKDLPQYGWNVAIAERFTTEQRFSFFLAGTSDRELDALAAANPPTREHVLAMDREHPMKGSKAIVSYRLAFVRSTEKELVVYEGCALESNDRYERHLKAIAEHVNRLFYNIANRWPGNIVCAYRAFSIHVEGPQERVTAMVLAERILVQYGDESVRHLARYLSTSRPSPERFGPILGPKIVEVRLIGRHVWRRSWQSSELEKVVANPSPPLRVGSPSDCPTAIDNCIP